MEEKEKNIIAFITKLNDRNIQRQRENGFTIYAILGGIIYTSIYLLNDVNIIFSMNNYFTNNTLLFVGIINFAPAIFYIWYVFKLIYNDEDYLKIHPFLFNKHLDYITIPSYIFFLFVTLLNIVTYTILESKAMSTTCILIFLIYYLLIVAISAYKFFISLKNEHNLPRTHSFFYEKTKGKIIANGLFALLFLLINIIFLKEILFGIPLDIITTLKYSVYFLGFLFLSYLMFNNFKKSNENKWLEELEKEIYMDGLKYEQIIDRLEKEYFGYKVDK